MTATMTGHERLSVAVRELSALPLGKFTVGDMLDIQFLHSANNEPHPDNVFVAYAQRGEIILQRAQGRLGTLELPDVAFGARRSDE
jgi:hypothetical protein